MRMTCYDGVNADVTDKIIRAAIEVHRELGCGLKEEAYEATLAWELEQRGMKVKRQMPYVDGERGARARLEQLNKYTIWQYEKNKARMAERALKNDARRKSQLYLMKGEAE